jgi:eukaryotic-like serine/threonine-protein kinase
VTSATEHADWARIEAALDDLLEVPLPERARALDRLTEGQPDLRTTLESLLAHADLPDDFLDRPAIESVSADRASVGTLPLGTHLGAYSIVRLIGRGGMGEVYRAVRIDGQFEQTVALKLLRGGSRTSVDRFNAERQILAALDHPSIARLYDGGVTADGHPYMVMEYVQGENLIAWCESHQAALPQRLTLFLQVCDAVAYAHLHLIVHRDLKPSNIFVTTEGRVKLLDFGIAKLLHTDALGDATRTAHVSPAYAAPEQLMGGTITTATDVYGLGVTLYQLLCGALPWQLADLPLAAAVRRLLEERVSPPSAAVRTDTPFGARELRGDLDAIVAKALRKDPKARYPDALALADDITRYRTHVPVRARAGARTYVMRRFLRRNWVSLSTASALFLLLLAGIVGTTWQAKNARRQAERASIEASKATAVKDFLLDIFRQSSLQTPGGVDARNVTAEKLLEIGAQRIRGGLAQAPEVRGELLDTLSGLYEDLGSTDRAISLAQDHLDDLRRRNTAAGAEGVAAHVSLARGLIDNGKDTEARVQLDAAEKILIARGEQQSMEFAEIEFQRARAAYDGSSDDKIAGLKHLHTAFAIVEKRDPSNSLRGDVLEYFGYYAQLNEDYDKAEFWKKQYLAFEEAQGLERNAFAIGTAHLDLGDAQELMRKYPDSESNLRSAVQILTKCAGVEHPSTAAAKMRLGELYFRMGRVTDADPLLNEALQAQQKTAQGLQDSTETGKTLGAMEYLRGRLPQAEAILRSNLSHLATRKDQELRYGVSASVLTSVLTAEGNFNEAEKQYALSSDVYRRYIGEKSTAYAGSLLRGATLKLGEGQPQQAAALYEQVLRGWPVSKGDLPDPYTRSTIGLARADLQRGDSEAARARVKDLLDRMLASPERQYLPDQEAHASRLLGEALTRLGRASEAEPFLRRAVELRENLDDADSFWLAEARISMANALIAERRISEAAQLIKLAAAAHAHQPALSNEYRAPLQDAQALIARSRT